jgi:hypothetical protein
VLGTGGVGRHSRAVKRGRNRRSGLATVCAKRGCTRPGRLAIASMAGDLRQSSTEATSQHSTDPDDDGGDSHHRPAIRLEARVAVLRSAGERARSTHGSALRS